MRVVSLLSVRWKRRDQVRLNNCFRVWSPSSWRRVMIQMPPNSHKHLWLRFFLRSSTWMIEQKKTGFGSCLRSKPWNSKIRCGRVSISDLKASNCFAERQTLFANVTKNLRNTKKWSKIWLPCFKQQAVPETKTWKESSLRCTTLRYLPSITFLKSISLVTQPSSLSSSPLHCKRRMLKSKLLLLKPSHVSCRQSMILMLLLNTKVWWRDYLML